LIAYNRAMRTFSAALALFCAAFSASAQLTIEVTGAGAKRIAIAIAPFPGEGSGLIPISAIVRADLERSGLFRAVEVPATGSLTEASNVNYAEWKARQADALVLGSVAARPDGRFEVRFKLFDTQRGADLSGVAYTLQSSQARATAHRIADYIYEKLTGEKGVFSTRIAFVVKRGPRHELQIADADGAGEESALVSNEPILSPAWSPDGRRLAYVSMENKKPVVYVHSLADGKRQAVANFRGSNSAPAWAPDGRTLAVVLSVEGGSQIFLINADGSGARRRLSSSSSIDTEPAFSPDGTALYFTSDRGGSAQIYRMPVAGGEAQRVTFEGTYNARPSLSPDGKLLAYVTRNAGKFQIAVLDLASRQAQIVTPDSDRDESPSFAPNGRMILLATINAGRGVLSAVSTDGRIKQRVPYTGGDVREPAWGPFIR
jgi:TolB protein